MRTSKLLYAVSAAMVLLLASCSSNEIEGSTEQPENSQEEVESEQLYSTTILVHPTGSPFEEIPAGHQAFFANEKERENFLIEHCGQVPSAYAAEIENYRAIYGQGMGHVMIHVNKDIEEKIHEMFTELEDIAEEGSYEIEDVDAIAAEVWRKFREKISGFILDSPHRPFTEIIEEEYGVVNHDFVLFTTDHAEEGVEVEAVRDVVFHAPTSWESFLNEHAAEKEISHYLRTSKEHGGEANFNTKKAREDAESATIERIATTTDVSSALLKDISITYIDNGLFEGVENPFTIMANRLARDCGK